MNIRAKIVLTEDFSILADYLFYELPSKGDYIRVDKKYYILESRIFDFSIENGSTIELRVRNQNN